MENFSKRTTGIISVGFLLFALFWGFGWDTVAQMSTPAVHCTCTYNAQHLVCTPAGKAV